EDGIRDGHVTGVQTCALPIFTLRPANVPCKDHRFPLPRLLTLVYVRCCNYGLYQCRPSRSSRRSDSLGPQLPDGYCGTLALLVRSEERRVGKECRGRWSPYG